MTQKIVIFDGDCAFCNRSVLFILKNARRNDIYVCSSQSDTGQKLILDNNIEASPSETLIYLEYNRVYIKSNAALNISKSLKSLYPMLIVFKLVPRFIRDGIYDFISKRRKLIIKNNSCSFELASTYADKVLA